MSDGKEGGKTDCVVHDHPVPPEEMARYSPVRDPDAEQDIARYVELETEQDVKHVEKVKEEYVLGAKYEIWDVVTDEDRWWVITNLTNLYSQKHFPSLDYTLSFHIGLMMRLRSRSSSEEESDYEPFEELHRRQQQAHNRHERAIEPEEFQAIGLMLRECLLSLIAALRRHVLVPHDVEHPKNADFVGWFELLMNILCPGSSNKQLRHYIKALGKETWQLANWLAHDRDANSAASSICIHSCDTLLGHAIQLTVRNRTGDIDACPRCKSRDIRSHYDRYIGPDGDYYSTCGSCGWSDHPETHAKDSNVE
ncbi:hypothetical protein MHY87_15315 [Microvirga sp. ACRRW]|uniref:hypothetical protein n=1 Tax=Microvirga sp. ACRRW TaxID=2918205 RepID=UPI001EF657C6|nr:hypothetical protein [Microvirga sp. ACRRW]MCG7394274.1 hypothetical protein [Microvirga sp. ACRRW]